MKNYISRQGHRKIVDELQFLTRVERPRITETVTVAAALGDRSENADYQYGKRRLREIDRRITFLLSRTTNMEVVDIKAPPGPLKAQFGATVEVLNLDEGLNARYTILGVDEVDVNLHHISWKSPLGNALLGKAVGDEVSYRGPAGEVTLRIQSIIYKELP